MMVAAAVAALSLLAVVGCGLCGVGVAAAEREMPDCDGVSYDNLERTYRITRVIDGVRLERSVSLRIAKDCDVTWPEDLSALGVRSIEIRNPRSSSRATLVLHATLPGSGGGTVSCTSPIDAFERMTLLCPAGTHEVAFELIPEN